MCGIRNELAFERETRERIGKPFPFCDVITFTSCWRVAALTFLLALDRCYFASDLASWRQCIHAKRRRVMTAANSSLQVRRAPSVASKRALAACAAIAALICDVGTSVAQDANEVLAEELANPLAALISLPFLGNYNGEVGTERGGSQWFVNIQPVIPFDLNADWHVISRTIFPVMFDQFGLFPGSGSQSGLRDTTEGLYFSPSKTFNGFTVGAGPIFLLPTGTDELLGAGKWGAGPTGVLVWQGSGWSDRHTR